jgi:hypothetical protein|tara:strand:+ start:3451 stop:3834 length:384 start_codon:yes stop_codon:yes gene_type:complete
MGDCDKDSECKSGNCADNVGLDYSQASWLDVCESPAGSATSTTQQQSNTQTQSGTSTSSATTTSTCTENWKCSLGPCVSNKQTQICTDLASCGTTVNKPTPKTQTCSSPGFFGRIGNFFRGGYGGGM